MKKTNLALIFLLFFFTKVFCQKQFDTTQKLVVTAKLWGFLKYYHPQVANGNLNWDKQLIEIIPKVKSAKTKKELVKVYMNWIETLGVLKDCRICDKKTKKEYFNKNFDLSWIDKSDFFSEKLSVKLKFIQNNRFQGNHFYLKKYIDGVVIMNNEISYKNKKFPDANYRLLGLFRYWNYIEYFYPYKYLTDQNWDDVLEEAVIKIMKVTSFDDYYLFLKELTAKLDDSHVFFDIDKSKIFKYFLGEVKNIEGKCVVFDLYNKNLAHSENIQIGDIVLKVNGVNIKDEVSKKLKYIPASNLNSKINRIYSYLLLSDEKDSLDITIQRGDHVFEKKIRIYERKYFDNLKKEKWKIINNDIGYVDMRLIMKEDLQEMMRELKNTQGIIFDLRGYPRDNNAYKRIPTYLDYGRRAYARFILPDLSYPGKYVWGEEIKTKGKKNKDPYLGKIVILGNDQSISRSEFAIMSLQSVKRAITIGSQTIGADGRNISFEYLGRYFTSMSSQGVFYPDKSQTQRIGVKIDIKVEPSIIGLKNGVDEVLEKAIEVIILLNSLKKKTN